jgi:hypothetical protein
MQVKNKSGKYIARLDDAQSSERIYNLISGYNYESARVQFGKAAPA